MDLGLQGKVIIVTASSKGIGKAIAKQFALEKAHVLISSRNEEELKKTKQEIISDTGNDFIDYAVCDLTNPSDINSLVEKAVRLYGGVDALINNTGGPPLGNFDDFEDESWQAAFELNLLSFIRTIRAVLPYMRKQGRGHIVNIASSSIKQPLDDLILSNTFRTGIIGLSKSLSQELAKDNILINTIGPGRVSTERVEHHDREKAERLNKSYLEVKSQSEGSIPIGRYGRPEELAKLVVFLSSDANTYTTGQGILVDGGRVKAL